MFAETTDTTQELEIQSLFEKQVIRSVDLRNQSISERKKKLKKLEQWILSNLASIHEAVYEDLHKPRIESDISEAFVVIGEIRHAIQNMGSWTRKKRVQTPLSLLPAQGWIKYEPKGVCLIISPWNFPFNLAIAPLVSCLAAGNTAFLKPSEHAPATSHLLVKMVSELYDPAEVVVIEGGAEVAQTLLKLPFNHIFFTGGENVGRKILESVASNMTPVTLELGGKSPVIIDESADLADAASKIVVGKYFNCGQTCIAPDFCVVHDSVYEKFLDEIKNAITRHYGDDESLTNSLDYGRIIHKGHHDRMVSLLNDAVSKGAKVVLGGKFEREDKYFGPTILSSVTNKMKVMREEIFGPILPVVSYSDLEKEIQNLSQMPAPLVVYAFSKHKSRLDEIRKRMVSGSLSWNDVAFYFTHPGLPFGGINSSGMGRGHGFAGFRTFSIEKSIFKQRVGWIPGKLVFPPFNRISRRIVKFMLKYL